jgi:signal peptidase I
MAKSRSSASKFRSAARSAEDSSPARRGRGRQEPPSRPPGRHLPSSSAVRETIESIVIAFVLAFLFRTFEAEAFVIPTGSMAPTLLGRHKEVACPGCEFTYTVSASDEVSEDGRARPRGPVLEATCPMCGFTADLGAANPERRDYPAYKGDRILVGKFNYELSDPSRWDVAVFKFPGEAQTNFIKRLVGLPGETIQIMHGDIFVRKETGPDAPFRIARKPPRKLLAMLQPVFDNDRMPEIMRRGWPPRWQPEPADGADPSGAWQPSDDYRSYATDGGAPGESWVRYHHWVPTRRQWDAMLQHGALPPDDPLRAELISDFSGYNSGRTGGGLGSRDTRPYWVGDLAVELTLEALSDQGEAILELVRGGRRFQCRFDLADGRATLSASGDDMAGFRPRAQTAVRGPGTYRLRFSNCDDQLLLWVDDKLVAFDQTTAFEPLGNHRPQRADLAPVGIGSRGAALRAAGLRVLRDIYYIARRDWHDGQTRQFIESAYSLHDPAEWNRQPKPDFVEFTLAEDQYLALGDNSAMSKDSRMWAGDGPSKDFFVRRELLTGKAIWIYWPDTRHKIHLPRFSIPYFPNFADMGFVR